jgi:periplasmic divalent cation tolerance protein
MNDVLLVLTHCPDAACAERISRALVTARLAACVSQGLPVTSIYRWQGAVEQAAEIPLAIKTTAARYGEVEAAIRAQHPYELPEIIAVPVTAGYTPYLRWVGEETTRPLTA